MVLSFDTLSVETTLAITSNIESIKNLIEVQKELIDNDLKLVVWERLSSQTCSVILLVPFKTITKTNPYFLLSNLLKHIGVEEEVVIEEISLNHLSDYSPYDDSIFHLGTLEEISKHDVEKFLGKALHEPLQEDECFIDEDYEELLSSELKRIRSYSQDHFSGNPCHYIFTSDSSEALDASNYLVLSLVKANRLHSSRVLDVELGLGSLWQLFKHQLSDNLPYCLGHVVRITLSDSFSKESARLRRKVFDRLVELIEEYGNTVLFILHFNESIYEESRTFLKRDVANLYIEFSKNEMSVEEAKQFIIEESYKYGVEPTVVIEELISASENKTYSRRELKIQLIISSKNKLYQPQFEPYLLLMNNKLESNEPHPDMKSDSSALEKLDQLIGLDKVKKVIKNMVMMHKLKPRLLEQGISVGQTSLHCCFVGQPGTAKTTVARILAQVLKEEGLLKTGVFVEVTRKDLVGQYVGQTAHKVKEAFERARGGVLFIDEAYALHDGYQHKSYGDEAIATLVELMENHRNDTIVIMAGYPKEMEAFLALNPGLHGRIPNMVTFNAYSLSEMMEIAKGMATSKGFEFDEEALMLLERVLQHARQLPSFANGRTVRNIVEKVIQKHIIQSFEVYQEPSKEQLSKIHSRSFDFIDGVVHQQRKRVHYH